MLRHLHSLSVIGCCSNLAIAVGDLHVLCVNATKLLSVASCQSIHCLLGNIKTAGRVVNGKDVDGLAVVCDGVAGTALQAKV